MSDEIAARLSEMGITLPEAAAPAANYVPYVISGNLLYISGQLPLEGGKVAVSRPHPARHQAERLRRLGA